MAGEAKKTAMNGSIDGALSAEDTAFTDELRDWLADNLTDEHRGAAEISALTDDAHYEVRLDWERRLAAGGWLGITWPKEFGGRAGTLTQEMLFLLEHGRAGAPYWVATQGRDLLGPMLLQHGTDHQKQRFLPPIMASEEFWGQGYSEPDAGSDLAGISTRAVLDDDQWVINGQKIWTSYGVHADWIFALCRTEQTTSRHEGLTLLLIPVDQPGVEVRPIRHLAGGQDFCQVFFTDALTDGDLVVGGVGNGWKVAMSGLTIERFMTAVPYQSRFPHQIALLIDEMRAQRRTADPVVRQQLACAWTRMRIIEWTNTRLMTKLLRGEDPGWWSSLAKLQWATWHRDTSADAIDLLGPPALLHGYDLAYDRFQSVFLNARAETIYAGSNEIQKTILGERGLGLPRAV